jgi:hypothetical protein
MRSSTRIFDARVFVPDANNARWPSYIARRAIVKRLVLTEDFWLLAVSTEEQSTGACTGGTSHAVKIVVSNATGGVTIANVTLTMAAN